MTEQTYTPQAVKLTQAAASKVWELIQEEENPELKLRAFVTGGGCSGMQYGFTFDEETGVDDTVIERLVGQEGDEAAAGTVQLLIDPMSLQYLMGAEIDYTEDLQGSQFVIRNPNAVTTCGCGSSFST